MFLLKQTRYNPLQLLISKFNSSKQSIINEKKKLLINNLTHDNYKILKKIKFNYIISNNLQIYLNLLIKNYKKLYNLQLNYKKRSINSKTSLTEKIIFPLINERSLQKI